MSEAICRDKRAVPSVPEPAFVRFHSLFPGCRPPQRAARAADGTLPTRAFQHCEPVCSASGFGWYLFPPMDLQLVWDGGRDIQWSYAGAEGWYQLGAAQFPGFAAAFDAAAPDHAKGFSPLFLAALREPGVVQINTGIIARTRPGWNLLLRAPANIPRDLGYDQYEGMVETDRWFAPLFTNIRLLKIGVPVRLSAGFPLVQAQPVQRSTLEDGVLGRFRVEEGLSALSEQDWEEFHRTLVRPNEDPHRRRGAYGVDVRRQRKRGAAGDPAIDEPS